MSKRSYAIGTNLDDDEIIELKILAVRAELSLSAYVTAVLRDRMLRESVSAAKEANAA